MLNALYKKTNNYKARYQEIEKFQKGVPNDLEIGCFGSSYARFDFDFSDFAINGFNFGIFPQPLHYDYILLKHYIQKFKKGAYVIFTFPALVFALDTYENDVSNYKYYKFLKKNEILNYSWKTKIFEVEFPLFKHPEKISKIWNDDDRIFNKILWTTSENLYENSQARDAAKERADGWCLQFGLENLKDVDVSQKVLTAFNKNIKIVDSMIQLCKNNELQPVLLIPPVADTLRELFSKEFLKRFVYDNLNKVKKEDAIILDCFENKQFGNYKLYSNSDFMNKVGRKEFTQYILGKLYLNSVGSKLKENCTGCATCKSICDKEAISMEHDKEGFWYPKIDKGRCVACGRCQKVCPVLNNSRKCDFKVEKVYAAWSLKEDVRLESTSGGIFSELALKCMENCGKVYGAAYNENFGVEHIRISKKEELFRIRQSKYVQSDMKNIFESIGRDLSTGEKVLFCGTPCQCQGLFNYLESIKVNMDSLIMIDFVCRGSNSPKVYQLFLKELEKEYNAKIKRVWFKNKTYGWNDFSTKIEFTNGKYYLKTRYEDPYIRGYIEKNLYIRPSCMSCKFKGQKRVSDITLADFWGVKLNLNQEETYNGTSLVIVHDEKGKKLFDEIKDQIFFEEKKFEDALKGNPCIMESAKEGEHRKQFFEDLDTLGFFKNIERFL